MKILALYAIFTATMFSLVGFVSLHFDEAVKTSHSIATLRVAWNQYLSRMPGYSFLGGCAPDGGSGFYRYRLDSAPGYF